MTTEKGLRSICKPVAVAVEGADYFYSLLAQIDGPVEFADVQLWDFAEIGSPERFVQLLKSLAGFSTKIRAVGLIRDAEESAESKRSELRRAFERNGLAVPSQAGVIAAGPPATGFLVMPVGKESGCIEHAFLESGACAASLECAKAFLKCVDRSDRNDNWRAKVQVHAIIAASDHPSATLGQSVKQKLWNLSHPTLGVMLDFVRRLAWG
ncbi:MAG: hypothetical protein NTU53_06880 [Planctomycetota bacterium]|nr:hypothetical protein [Planctomycetota bacterium]